MPYRINPKNTLEVLVKRGGRWVVLKRHTSPIKARKHLAALQINVVEKEKSK
ncbi:hypothetical protein MUP59_09590 [Candidatus Bathyarchaeota archaeon]|nr:hypothetical protein [Candidatus Bathyarchaeota archaeon]